MDSLYIIIPAYNEAENISMIIEEWYSVVDKYNGDGRSRLVIIDDGSKDATFEIMQKEKENRPLLEIISKENGGHGSTIYFGYEYALKQGADYIFQTDSDGQTLAGEFDSFFSARNEYDVQIGDRKKRGDGFARRFISGIVRLVVLCTFHVNVRDVNTPYRLMNRRALSTAFTYLPKEYNLTNIALTGIFGRLADVKNDSSVRINMRFIPITFRPRQGGINSINPAGIIKIGVPAIKNLFEISHKMRK